ncbi:MAG: histidine--tRNA ligase [Nanoarchaeota archaeon]|nr:histidine--tRNA ligase [Nanoarchaeota archaeon]
MPVKGMRDFPPKDMILRQKVFAIVRNVFERYGFEPFETPAIELAKTLKGKYGEEEKLIYEFEDRGGRKLALRYDQTVPLVRYIVENPEIPKPFRRYVIGKAWRAEEVRKGRYREFYQCDIDTVGAKSILADAEVIACALEALNNLNLKDSYIRLNNRKILAAIIKYAGVKENKVIQVIRTIDKLDKLGEEGVKGELKKLKLRVSEIKKILEVISISGKPNEVVLKAKKVIGKIKEGVEGLEELQELISYLKEFGVKNYVVDLSLARGLDYYTGNIFEIMGKNKKIGSLGGGGRYDKLIAKLSGEKIDLPAVGLALGIERIIEIVKEQNLIQTPPTVVEVYVLPVKKETIPKAINIAKNLRENGFNCEIDLMGRKISRQLEYASSKGIPKVIIVGPKDLAKRKVTIRDMKTGKEEKVNIKDIVGALE